MGKPEKAAFTHPAPSIPFGSINGTVLSDKLFPTFPVSLLKPSQDLGSSPAAGKDTALEEPALRLPLLSPIARPC